MKTFCLFITVILFLAQIASGEIKNGYGLQIDDARMSLTALNDLARKSSSKSERRKLAREIQKVENFIFNYELTNDLLSQFRNIAPELYSEIDSIKDQRRRPTDVFVKFISRSDSHFRFPGTTSLDHAEDDYDASRSVYGDRSVSIYVWITDNSLVILAHELGHVKYQVPNLERYATYYKQAYGTTGQQGHLGHNPSDLSGKCAVQFEKAFTRKHRTNSTIREFERVSPYALLKTIKKRSVPETDLLTKNN